MFPCNEGVPFAQADAAKADRDLQYLLTMTPGSLSWQPSPARSKSDSTHESSTLTDLNQDAKYGGSVLKIQ